MNWDEYFCAILEVVASKSQDPSSQYGAVIVSEENQILSTGYNGLPRGMEYDDPKYFERPDKYMYFIHAEVNAILNAAMIGVQLKGSTMYIIKPPCAGCMGAIVNAGIYRLVYMLPHVLGEDENFDDSNWRMSMDAAKDIGERGNILIQVANLLDPPQVPEDPDDIPF